MRRAVACALGGLCLLPAAAGARVLRAESILPPGQSGFVSLVGLTSGAGSPHLYDQNALYVGFRWKPAGLGQPGGVAETPRPGVRIVRDAYGVPSITGDTDANLWWGAGFAVAQDRLFELEAFRHATEGRLAELVGRSYLDDDLIARQDFYTPAELDRQFARLPASFQARYVAYRDGVNAWVDHVRSNPLDLPAEYAAVGLLPSPFGIRDLVAIGVYLARITPPVNNLQNVELADLRALQRAGARTFDRLLPLHPSGTLTTIPRSSGTFPSQPGRTRAQERAAFIRSVRFAERLPFPRGLIASATTPRNEPALAPRLGGSYVFAVRRRGDRHAFLYNGPQVGFAAPEKLIELELHGPGLDVRGMTAPGAPVIASGHNDAIAFGITSGESDTDDLYAESLVPREPEKYYFRGAVRTMDCRNETFRYATPLSDVLLHRKVPESGSVVRRICRTVHGPVQFRAGNVAYARRYAIWGRETETLPALAEVNRARNIRQVGAAVRKLSWNENLMAIDSTGNIGYWHPGLFPLRPRAWDERLPYPGTGEAEWRGLRARRTMPNVINPKQGWLANWNTTPAVGWTVGDATGRKLLDGPYNRAGWLMRLVRGLARAPSFEGVEDVIRRAGTVAQQFPIARPKLARALHGATGKAAKLLRALLAWDGDYNRTASDGTVDPGVAIWKEFRTQAEHGALGSLGAALADFADDESIAPLYGRYHFPASGFHIFDASHTESYALRTLAPDGYRAAASLAFAKLSARFNTPDTARWREPRRLYPVAVLGAEQPPDLPFFDRGTFEQIVETGP